MSRLEEFLVGVIVVIGIAVGGWFALEHYGTKHYDAGYAAAVEAGVKLRQAEADRNRDVENDLRARVAAADADAFKKGQEYASNLEAAQRRVRAGTDRLQCPTTGAIQPGASAGDRPAAGGPTADGEGQAMVPEVSAAILGFVADHQRLVRNYDRLTQRFEECRAVNSR